MYDVKLNALTKCLIGILGISFGILTWKSPAVSIILVFSYVFFILNIKKPRRYLITLVYLIVLKDLLSVILLKYGFISPHTTISSLLYFLPDLSLWVGLALTILININKFDGFVLPDLLAIVMLLYLIEKCLTGTTFDSNIMLSYFRTGLCIAAYFFGRFVPRKIGPVIFKHLKLINYLMLLFGIADVISQHGIMIALGLGQYMSNFASLLDNPSLTILYHNGLPRLLGLFGSALATGLWSTGTSLIWLYCYVRWGRKFLLPLLASYAMLVLSLTRADWLATLVGSLILLFNPYLKQKKKRVLIITAAVSLITLTLYFNLYGIRDMILVTISGSESSAVSHTNALLNGITAIKASGLFGKGIAFSPYFTGQVSNFESWYLDIIYSVGLPFVLLLFGLASLAIAKLNNNIRPLFLAQFLAYSIDGLMNHSWYVWIPVYLFWIPLGYYVTSHKTDSQRGEKNGKENTSSLRFE